MSSLKIAALAGIASLGIAITLAPLTALAQASQSDDQQEKASMAACGAEAKTFVAIQACAENVERAHWQKTAPALLPAFEIKAATDLQIAEQMDRGTLTPEAGKAATQRASDAFMSQMSSARQAATDAQIAAVAHDEWVIRDPVIKGNYEIIDADSIGDGPYVHYWSAVRRVASSDPNISYNTVEREEVCVGAPETGVATFNQHLASGNIQVHTEYLFPDRKPIQPGTLRARVHEFVCSSKDPATMKKMGAQYSDLGGFADVDFNMIHGLEFVTSQSAKAN